MPPPFGEAIARGLPIVDSAVGTVQEIVPPDCGMLVAPGDASALREALRRVIEDADARNRMAKSASMAAEPLPRRQDSAIAFAKVLEALT
jgi:glycosyltransferase involved in cell wall biosynthesis